MRLKGSGWAYEYRGTFMSLEVIFKACWPELKLDPTLEGKYYAVTKFDAAIRTPPQNILILKPGQWAYYYDGDYDARDSIPEEWIETESNFTKNIMFDWFNNVR